MSHDLNTTNQLRLFNKSSLLNNNRAPVLLSTEKEKRANGNRARFTVEEGLQVNCLHNTQYGKWINDLMLRKFFSSWWH